MPMCRTGSACAQETRAAAPASEARSRRIARMIPKGGYRFAQNIMRERRLSLRREAVEQPVATRARQVGLAASAVRSARGMRGIPRQHGRRGIEALAVVMSHHGGTSGTLGPVAARAIFTGRECGAVGLRAGQDVV